MQLRWYQAEAVEAAWQWCANNQGNPCIELPTGAGKSLVIAQLMADVVESWGCRVIMLAHRKELLEQNEDKLKSLVPGLGVGVYSAGLKRREADADALIAGVQSVWNKAAELGHRDIMIVDEAHLIPAEGEGMYLTLIKDLLAINPRLRVVGLTATPYRLKEGLVCGNGHILDEICYRVGVPELIEQGYLCPVSSKATVAKADAEGVHVRGGEWVQSELADHLADREKVDAAVDEIWLKAADRHSIIIFCAGVPHAEMVRDALCELTDAVGLVTGETSATMRAEVLGAFKSQALRFLVNVDVLTTGFDAPNVDCVAMLRPTLSPGLYYQMAGRGFRIDKSKENCLVLDFAGNVERHGPIDKIDVKPQTKTTGTGEPVTRKCPECDELNVAATRVCAACGFEFPEPEIKHAIKASKAPVLDEPAEPQTRHVRDVFFHVHTKKGADIDTPKTMRVDYVLGLTESVSEWVCVEHTGFARRKAEQWWAKRSHMPLPDTAAEAVALAKGGALCSTDEVDVVWARNKQEYNRVTRHGLGKKPELESLAARGGFSSFDEMVKENDFVREAVDLFAATLVEEQDDVPF